MAVVLKKKNIDQKTKTIKQIDELYCKYPFLIISDSDNIKSELIHELRSKIAHNSKILFGKKKIMFKALQKKNVKINEKMFEKCDYSTIFLIFTKELCVTEYLKTMGIKGYLKTGDTCNEDVMLQAGVIRVNEQPINSDMNAKLNACDLPSYIKDGKVVVDKLQFIAKKGEKVNSKQAKLLKLLG
ncbi:mRNA turnover and ribosome assembly protein [Binucleata daphniae]